MDTIADRMKYAMSVRNMKQAELVDKTGIGKSSISQYLSGHYEPKKKNLYLIAKAMDVNENWLLGNEVPMERKKYKLGSELFKMLEQISETLNLPLETLSDAFVGNTELIKIKAEDGHKVLNYDNLLYSIQNAIYNKYSAEALEVAEAYDEANLKTKNIIRLTLDLPNINSTNKTTKEG